MKLWNGLVKTYLAISIVLGVGTFVLISSDAPASIRRCLSAQAEHGGVSALSEKPNIVVFSAYRGLLWPVSLVHNVVLEGMSPVKWLLLRYDPFPGSCRR